MANQMKFSPEVCERAVRLGDKVFMHTCPRKNQADMYAHGSNRFGGS